MTEEDLLAAGYHRCGYCPLKKHASRFYQRAVREDDKKAYFINVYVYLHTPGMCDFALQAEADLYLTGDRWLTLEFHHVERQSVAQMEALFFEVWSKLGGIPDPHNND